MTTETFRIVCVLAYFRNKGSSDRWLWSWMSAWLGLNVFADVVYAYSAMTLDRPYRKSLSREQAREELLKAAGSQFDPRLVRRFLEIIDSRDPGRVKAGAEAG